MQQFELSYSSSTAKMKSGGGLKLLLIIAVLPSARPQCVIVSLPPSYRDTYSCNAEWRTGEEPASRLIFSDSESEYETLVKYVSSSVAFTTRENVTVGDCSEVVGVVGDVGSKTAMILHTLASRSNLSLTQVAAISPPTFLPLTDPIPPGVLDMQPLSHYTEAVVSFINQWNWTRIGLISDSSLYYGYAAEILYRELLQAPDRIVTPLVTVRRDSDSGRALKTVQEYGTHIIIVLMESPCHLLDIADSLDMMWPSYAWITLPQANGEVCNVEGIFVLQDVSNFFDISCRLVHDALLAVSSTTSTARSNSSFISVTGLVQFRQGKRLNNISISQVSNSSGQIVAYYDPEEQDLLVVHNLLAGKSPDGGTLVIRFGESTLRVATVSTLFIFFFIFVSIVLFLYLYFRKEPEIKATSVSVSLCMFLGCYLTLFVPPLLLIVGERYTAPVCALQASLSVFGLPTSLILSTLFVKMIRVYTIFFKPFQSKTILLSDLFLVFLILLLELPSITILLLWFTIDPVEVRRIEVEHKDHITITHRCYSNHTLVWVYLQFSYLGLLIIAVMILAFKSSEIRYRNFRDTKATNAYTYITIMLTFLIIFYWQFFRSLGQDFNDILKSSITLFTGHFLLPLVCQTFLFIPKIYVPIRKHLFENNVKSKSSEA